MADASQVPDGWQPVAGILSCFSLQQMAQPAAVLAAWAASLAPGGVLAVAYWCALLQWRRLYLTRRWELYLQPLAACLLFAVLARAGAPYEPALSSREGRLQQALHDHVGSV